MRSTFLMFLLLCVAPVRAQSIYVRLLGTAGPSLNPTQAEAGLLVVAGTEVLLFDCGHGIPNRLAQVNRIGLSKVFLTHVHSDHTEGLPELWMNENTWSARGSTPLSVWGPPELAPDQPSGTADITNQLTTAFATNTHIRARFGRASAWRRDYVSDDGDCE